MGRSLKRVEIEEQTWPHWAELRVGDAAAQYAFWDTLAKRQGWTIAFAENVFGEYRKWLFLVLTAPSPVAPPPPIRAVWDLHRELPSWRTLPESAEIERRVPMSNPDLEQTRAFYTGAFGTYPPESIWPARTRPGKRRSGLAAWLGLGKKAKDLERLARAVDKALL
ncbi:MAG: hypothetical protein K2X03_05100 [Bryobacteraceae bacterium]|nr:hypothetical protein [Bryobacteraceae bacterium]